MSQSQRINHSDLFRQTLVINFCFNKILIGKLQFLAQLRKIAHSHYSVLNVVHFKVLIYIFFFWFIPVFVETDMKRSCSENPNLRLRLPSLKSNSQEISGTTGTTFFCDILRHSVCDWTTFPTFFWHWHVRNDIFLQQNFSIKLACCQIVSRLDFDCQFFLNPHRFKNTVLFSGKLFDCFPKFTSAKIDIS